MTKRGGNDDRAGVGAGGGSVMGTRANATTIYDTLAILRLDLAGREKRVAELEAALEEIAALVEKEPDKERRRYWHQMMSPEEYDFERGAWCAVKIARKALEGQGDQ